MKPSKTSGEQNATSPNGNQGAPMRDIRIRVKSAAAPCRCGHIPGQTFLVPGGLTPGGICLRAFASLAPAVQLLASRGRMPWGVIDALDVVCPNPDAKILFELTADSPAPADNPSPQRKPAPRPKLKNG